MITEIQLRCEPASAARARTFVRSALLVAGCDDETIDRAVLLTSELVTSAVVHAPKRFVLQLTIGDTIRIAVTDDLPSLPVAPDRTGEPKLTLYLLDALSKTWGWDPVERGKTVWCELSVTPDWRSRSEEGARGGLEGEELGLGAEATAEAGE